MKRTLLVRGIGTFMILGGLGLLASVAYPIFSYELAQSPPLHAFLSPVPEKEGGIATSADSFFPTANAANNNVSASIRYYNITVPKLGIEDAVVSIGGEDLADSLIQYPGTALPGKIGNTVVFGHSVLPVFYDPKVYLSIFSTLPSLRKGDRVEATYDGISYTYEVYEMYEVLPSNLEVLSQNSPGAELSLVTCVPPGDPRRPRRLVVKARLLTPSDISYEPTKNNTGR